MIRTFILTALLATGALHAAIKKDPNSKPDPAPAAPAEKPQMPPKPAAPAAKPDNKGAADLIEELRKRAEREGGMLRMEPKELLGMLRSALEKQGVPADQIKNAGLPELLRLMKEKNPDAFKGLGLGGGMPGLDKATEKKLDDHFNQLLDGLKPGSLASAPATFTLRDGKKPADPLGFATGVRTDGWILVKASDASAAGELQCQIKGEWVAAKIVRTWQDHDLALAKVSAKDIPAVKFSTRTAPEVGTFITAVAPEGRRPVGIGIVSVPVRNEQEKGRGFLGVQLDTDDKGVLKVKSLVEKGPAEASGIKMEDRILELDGKKPDSIFTFTRMVSDRKAGDKVRLKVQRGDAIVEKEIALGDRGTSAAGGPRRGGNDRMNTMGSTISKRRTDFPSVLQTDLPLQSTQCGGPVTDLDGNVIGMVIARSGRVDTKVLPSETIRGLLGGVDFSKEGQTPPPAAVATKPQPAKPEAPKPEAPKPAVVQPAPAVKSEPPKPAPQAAPKSEPAKPADLPPQK